MIDETIFIPAADANIIARYDDAELVAVLHDNGYVGLYAEDDDRLALISDLRKSKTLSPVEIANLMILGGK